MGRVCARWDTSRGPMIMRTGLPMDPATRGDPRQTAAPQGPLSPSPEARGRSARPTAAAERRPGGCRPTTRPTVQHPLRLRAIPPLRREGEGGDPSRARLVPRRNPGSTRGSNFEAGLRERGEMGGREAGRPSTDERGRSGNRRRSSVALRSLVFRFQAALQTCSMLWRTRSEQPLTCQ